MKQKLSQIFFVFVTASSFFGCGGGGGGSDLRFCNPDSDFQTLRIMPLGDSITEARSGHSSYRRSLYLNLTAAGCAVDFVGSRYGVSYGSRDSGFAAPPFTDFDQNHEGHWEYSSADILNGVSDWASANIPDLVLLHTGTNDVLRNYPLPNTLANIEGIIAELRAANPSVAIAVAQIIPTSRNVERVTAFNAALPALAAKLNTKDSPVQIVDQFTGFSNSADTYDGVHPNDSGENKLAQGWAAAILGWLN